MPIRIHDAHAHELKQIGVMALQFQECQTAECRRDKCRDIGIACEIGDSQPDDEQNDQKYRFDGDPDICLIFVFA